MNRADAIWRQAGHQAHDMIVSRQEHYVDRKFHADRVNPFAGHQPQRFFGAKVGSFQQTYQAGEKIIRLPHLGSEPSLFG